MKVNGQSTGGWLLLIIALIGTSVRCTEPPRSRAALSGPVDTNTIVRFFYIPTQSYAHPPLVLRVVGEKDPRLNTAPLSNVGRTVYISLEIVMLFSTGTARTVITPSTVCATLAPLDVALRNRARWEFQLFRVEYNCGVPGFDRHKYPEHDRPEREAK